MELIVRYTDLGRLTEQRDFGGVPSGTQVTRPDRISSQRLNRCTLLDKCECSREVSRAETMRTACRWRTIVYMEAVRTVDLFATRITFIRLALPLRRSVAQSVVVFSAATQARCSMHRCSSVS